MQHKKWLKAAVAAALAVLTSSALAAGAHAAPGDALPPATGDLVIHKYIGAPVSGQSSTGVQVDDSAWSGVIAADGVAFDLFKVGAPVNTSAPQGTTWPDVPLTGDFVRNPGTGNLEVREGATLVGEYSLAAATPDSVTTGPNGTATAAGLAQGLYLVIENPAKSTSITDAATGEPLFISQAAAPFVVAVPMTAPDGQSWLDVVHVYPKNEAFTVDKTATTDGAVAVGDTVSYTITVSVPGDIATAKKFAIYDTFDAALDLDLASVTVTTVPELTGAGALVKNTDYTITYNPPTRTLSIAFAPEGRVKLAGTTSVVVTLDTTVNATILTAPGNTVSNTARGEFTNKDDVTFQADSGGGSESQISTATVSVTKVDQAGKALNGATFGIATSQANAAAGHFLRLDPATKVVHDYDASPTSAWATLGAAADYVIAPSNEASFTGLRDVVEVNGQPVWQTYWVVEIQAPATYNLLADPIAVAFADARATFADPADYDHVYHLTVTNSKGFTLPETGGAGTIGLTVAGVVLMGSAVLVGITRRKKTADEAC